MPDPLNQEQILEKLTGVLNDSKSRTEMQLSNLERKIDQLTKDVSAVENELRREIQTQFVTKAEYEPRHRILETKIGDFDRHIMLSDQESRDFAVTRVEVQQLKVDLEALENRQARVAKSIAPWISILIAALAFLITVLQHVHFN